MIKHPEEAKKIIDDVKIEIEKNLSKNLNILIKKKVIKKDDYDKYNKGKYAELVNAAVENFKIKNNDDKLFMITNNEKLLKESK